MNTKSEVGNQQPSVVRGDPGVDRTPTAPSRDPSSSISPITEAPTSVEAKPRKGLRLPWRVDDDFIRDASNRVVCQGFNKHEEQFWGWARNSQAIVDYVNAALTTALAHRQTGEITTAEQESRVDRKGRA